MVLQKKILSTAPLSYSKCKQKIFVWHYANFKLCSQAVVIRRGELLQLQSSRSWYVDFGLGW